MCRAARDDSLNGAGTRDSGLGKSMERTPFQRQGVEAVRKDGFGGM